MADQYLLAIANLAQEVVAEVAVVVLPMLQKACPERVVEAVAAVVVAKITPRTSSLEWMVVVEAAVAEVSMGTEVAL